MKTKILNLHTDWTKSEERKKTNGAGGCGYYRIMKPSEYMRPEYDVDAWGREWEDTYNECGKHNEYFYEQIFGEYDIIRMHYIDNAKMFAWMWAANQKHKKKIVVDIDDNFLDVDDTNPAKKQFEKNKMSKANLATILSFADAITVSTLPLKERLHKHLKEVHNVEKPIFVLPNYNDIKDWNYKKIESSPDGVVIGYMGSISHAGDLKMVLPSIKKVLQKYPTAVFQLMGQLTVSQAKKVFKDWSQDLRKRLYMVNPTANFVDFPLWFSQQPWDIGIAPLLDTEFNKCKSHIKFLEYSMYKIPTVASKVYPYYMDVLGIPTIQDGETGLLAKDDEWVDKLSLLIENKELREKIGQNAYEAVKKNWQYENHKEYILSVIKKIKEL